MKNNWQTKKLENCLDKVVYTNKIQRKDFLKSGVFPIVSQEEDFINGYWDDKEDLFEVKTPVTIFGDHTKVLKYVDFDFILGADGVKILQPKAFLDSRFFYYFLQSVKLKDLGYARHYRLLKEIKILYPESLSEQRRIVKILDEVSERIGKAKENAEKNLKNSRELFESYLQSVFVNQGKNPASAKSSGEAKWEEKTLGEVLQKTETVDPTKNPNKEFIYIDVSSVNKENLTIENTSLLIGKDAPSQARKLVRANDVIFATVRPTLRRIAVIPAEFNEQICSTGYFVLRAKKELDNKLVFYFIQTKAFNEKMEKLQKGASYPAVTGGDVRNQIISFPESLSEQKSIVKKLDALAAETKKLEAIYKQKLADLEELKKSVLRKAFSGEL